VGPSHRRDAVEMYLSAGRDGCFGFAYARRCARTAMPRIVVGLNGGMSAAMGGRSGEGDVVFYLSLIIGGGVG